MEYGCNEIHKWSVFSGIVAKGHLKLFAEAKLQKKHNSTYLTATGFEYTAT